MPATESAASLAEVDRSAFGRRHLAGAAIAFLILAFCQDPGKIAADTKYDLSQNPIGFLARAAHLWSSQAPLGQVQNQAYGYFFPHGAFFSLGHLLHIPAWITQRLWWAILLTAGFWGMIRLAEALGIGNRGSRVLAAIAFALSPRILTTIGPISSESLPMMLAPWVLLPLVRLWNGDLTPLRAAARSAVAVALMGSVNAVATFAACVPAGIWWLLTKPNKMWLRFTGWWVLFLALATVWWLVPLLLLGRLSPPFLDFIESAGVTTQWNSLVEVLRGTDSWSSFVSPDRIAGSVLITQPSTVLATGAIAVAGLMGLTLTSMPARGRLTVMFLTGVVILTVGYPDALGSAIAEPVRHFLDGAGAPLRNVHKFDPLIRLPLALGLAHLLAKVPLPLATPWRRLASLLAHVERHRALAGAALILVAVTVATAVAWTGRLAPRGTYDEVPQYWHDTADWLADNAPHTRALVVPGAPFGSQSWGLTRDEPLQALARSPWAVRDAIPLNPPGAIRALDAIQRLFASGQPSPMLAAALRSMGVGYLVVRNDLDPETSQSTRPLLVHHVLESSPNLRKVAEFGELPDTTKQPGIVYDTELRPPYKPVEIYRVLPQDPDPTDPYTAAIADIPVVDGGPEALIRMGMPTALLAADAARAGVSAPLVTVTDTPLNREIDYGRVDDHASAIRAIDDPRRTLNARADYPVDGARLISAEWVGAQVTVSSSAADAVQLGGVSPSSSAGSAFDGDPGTSWVSEGSKGALGEWMQLNLDHPITSGILYIRTSAAAYGSRVADIEISTDIGSTGARVSAPGTPVAIALPPGRTTWIRITAKATVDGTVGNQFGLAEVSLKDFADADNPVFVPIYQHVIVPAPGAGSTIAGWDLGQELPGRPACFDSSDRVRCSPALLLPPEEEHFARTLDVPSTVTVYPVLTVRSRPGAELERILTTLPLSTIGGANVADVRGSAFAATDGDVRTTWTAPDSTVSTTGGRATITVLLPAPRLVTGIRLTRSLGQLPAAPQHVSVNLGAGPQSLTVPSSSTATIAVHPQVTDRIDISIADWRPTLDRTPAGFNVSQAPGIAEVALIGEDGAVIRATPQPSDRVIDIPCGEGPTITIGTTAIPTSVRATVAQLKSNEVLEASPCLGSAELPVGNANVRVEAGPLFVTDQLRLNTGTPVPDPRHVPVTKDDWTNSHREVDVQASPQAQVLVVPESTNAGWTATAHGKNLQPITVNGWQQGWIVPPGVTRVTLEFALDTWYRVAIFGGLLLLLPLFALALVGGRGRTSIRLNTPTIIWLGAIGVVAACAAISGVVGAVIGVGALLAEPYVRRRWPRWVSAAVGITYGLAVALLSRGPWQSMTGYLGHSTTIQFLCLVAVAVTGAAAVGAPEWLRSQRREATRSGSSTSA
ncbi:MAG: alpha-(1-_3)-arabinofuranosyltransferase [Nocardiaceae bacterium]|nr:alpha-(1->3)-arabinofuranosyltransferase [Nocardiaceae bacterium]